MAWFRVDDSLGMHPKARSAGLAAMGLWVMAGSIAASNRSNGHVPPWVVDSFKNGSRLAHNLLTVGLWHEAQHDCASCPTFESGYVFHEWGERNLTSDDYETKRKAGQAGGKARGKQVLKHPDEHGTDHVPRPSRTHSGGSVGEGSSTTARAGAYAHARETDAPSSTPPPSTCSEHRDSLNPPACRECKRQRENYEAWETKQRQYRESLRDEIEQAKRNRKLECEHGTEGGSHIRSDNGEYLCPFCRRGHTPEPNTDSQNDGNGE